MKRVAVSVTVLGIALVVAAATILWRPALESWSLRQLETGPGGALETRRAAAARLGRLGSRRAIPLLDECLLDPDDELRLAAAVALKRIDPERPVFPPYVSHRGDRSGRAVAIGAGRIPLWEFVKFIADWCGAVVTIDDSALLDGETEIEVPVDFSEVSPAVVFALLEVSGVRAHQDGLLEGNRNLSLREHEEFDELRLRAAGLLLDHLDLSGLAELILDSRQTWLRLLAIERLPREGPEARISAQCLELVLRIARDGDPELLEAARRALAAGIRGDMTERGREPEPRRK